jgi:hypothetical protein
MKCFILLLAFSLVSSSLYAQGTRVLKICLNAYPLSSSTLVGVDSIQIKYSAPTKIKIKNAEKFLVELEKGLNKKDTISLRMFKPNFVRLFFRIYYKGGEIRSIYLAQGSSLLYGKKLYQLDNDLKHIIRKFIPNKDGYLPVKSNNK